MSTTAQAKPAPPAKPERMLKMYRVKVGKITDWDPEAPIPTKEEYAEGVRRKEKTWRPGEVAITESDLLEKFGHQKFEFLGFYTAPDKVPKALNPTSGRGVAGHTDYTRDELEKLRFEEVRALAEAEDIAVRGTTKEKYIEAILAHQAAAKAPVTV